MSAPYIIPVSDNPASTAAGINTTYTVPAGKYARVAVTLDADVYLSSITGVVGISVNYIDISNSPASTSIVLLLKTADSLTVTNSASTATATSNAIGNKINTAISTTSISVNGTVVAKISSRIIVVDDIVDSSNPLSTVTRTFAGTSNAAWLASEYFNI